MSKREPNTGVSPGLQPGQPKRVAQIPFQDPTALSVAGCIQALDVLPPEAQQDPAFQAGMGAAFAANQPQLALKYGVIRNGRRIPPQDIQGQPTQRVSQQVAEGLKAVLEASRQNSLLKNDEQQLADARVENEAKQGTAATAAIIGNAPGDTNTKPITEEEKKRITEAAKGMDEFDWDSFRQMMMRDVLNNDEQRKIIESRCRPMDIGELLTQYFVLQDVPIVIGKFTPTFRSSTGEDDLAIKRLIMEEAKKLQVEERYLLDKFAIMSLTIGLYAINGKPIIDHRDNEGRFSEELFWRKFTAILRYPLHMLSSLGVNYFWFDIRVRRLFVAEQVKNG